MAGKKKYFFHRAFKLIPKEDIRSFMEKEVFCLDEFKQDVDRVSENLNMDRGLVKDVLESYFVNIMIIINSVRKIKTKINIYAFCSIVIEPGRKI